MPTDGQYQQLLAFRNELRRFDQWSRQQAERVGLTHAQHQLLLAIRGSATPEGPTIGEVAEALLIRHHSASELIDRSQDLGLLVRVRDAGDSRRVHLRLTDHGHELLQRLTEVHLGELARLAEHLHGLPDTTAEVGRPE